MIITSVGMERPGRKLAAEIARHIVELERLKARCLPSLDHEAPEWLILIDLFINGEGEQKVSVSSLCIASGVPATTALRRIGALEKKGYVERYREDGDRRAVFIRLTVQAHEEMVEILSSVARGNYR